VGLLMSAPQDYLMPCPSPQDYADVCFDVHGEKNFAHKCILFARSEFFSEKLMSKWQTKSVIRLNSKHLYPWTFKVFMQVRDV
jgi:hypothetical protein